MLTHKGCGRLVALSAAVLVVGCSTIPDRSAGQRVCRTHRSSLVTVAAFEARPEVIVDPSAAEIIALRRYPHFIQSGRSLERSAANPIPTKLTYCPKCEAAAKRIRGLQRI